MAIQRTEFSSGEPGKNLMGECCPRCAGSLWEWDAIDYTEAPDLVVCGNCGLHFRLVMVAVWDDSQPVIPAPALQDCLPEKR